MRRMLVSGALGGVLLLAAISAPAMATPAADDAERSSDLYLVTLTGPGTAGHRGDLDSEYRTRMLSQQDATLEILGADEPVYRWTTALNGFAVDLSSEQVAEAKGLAQVARVERDSVRPVTGTATAGSPAASKPGSGGRGTVIGVIDTGISPDTPALGASTTLGPTPKSFHGSCEAADGWSASDCTDKVVAATWFVKGFGDNNLRSGASVSPRDDAGHGTQVASIAAGNQDVTALSSGRKFGTFSGTAPDARVAVYKACWSAPDPEDDGCSTADVVSAVDRAVSDGVDVLNLSVASGDGLDTVDLALLGAAERDIFVATAAGNDGSATGYRQPWVTTVGASSGPDRTGALELPDAPPVKGILTARRLPDEAPVILAADVPAPGHEKSEARLCAPGSLDAGRVSGKIVLCERGTVARVDKSAAVRLADGVGMVLVNARGEGLSADFHAVPTLHVDAAQGARLRRAVRAPGPVRGELVHTSRATGVPHVLPWSARGTAGSAVVKPDVVAAGFGLLAGSTPAADGTRWSLLSGTSGAAARVSGLAARVRSTHPRWSAQRVRSAVMTTSRPVAAQPTSLRQGAGRAGSRTSQRPGLVYDLSPAAYRRALMNDSDVSRLNLPSAQRHVPASGTVITRRVTNVGKRAMYYSSSATGFDRHQVLVMPAAIKIAPGETRTFRIRVRRAGTGTAPDSGWVTWRGANGKRVRIPVVLTR